MSTTTILEPAYFAPIHSISIWIRDIGIYNAYKPRDTVPFIGVAVKNILPVVWSQLTQSAPLLYWFKGTVSRDFRSLFYIKSNFWGDFAVSDWWRYCKSVCNVKFRQIEGNSRTFCNIELRNTHLKCSNSKVSLQWWQWCVHRLLIHWDEKKKSSRLRHYFWVQTGQTLIAA